MSSTAPNAGVLPSNVPERWRLLMIDEGPSANAAQAETLFALSNGLLGVRGGREEQPSATDGAFLAAVYECVPIHYHEAFPGFARSSDTRVPVADGKRIRIRLGPTAIDLCAGERLHCRRILDLQHGLLHRTTLWRAPGGGTLEINATRLVPLNGGTLLAIRLSIRSIDYRGPVLLESCIEATDAAVRAEDPRMGAESGAALTVGERRIEGASAVMTQSAQRSGIQVAISQTHRAVTDMSAENPIDGEPKSVGQRFQAELVPDGCVTIEKFVAWAAGSHPDSLSRQAVSAAEDAAGLGFEALEVAHAAAWSAFWSDADLGLDGDPSLDQALHFSLFHVRQSAPPDGRHALAAKGLTGQGYEGHVFWDTEVFALPVLQMTAPLLARASLDWRASTLPAARAHARELNHPIGALYPWRTIAGDEGSGYFPSGSAQYHINAAIAFALRLQHLGNDPLPVNSEDAAVLFETARIWMQIGHHDPARAGAFCIHSVTGPDEYSALVNNDYYSNRMAQMHLRYAADVAGRLARSSPDDYRSLAHGMDLLDAEPTAWRRAADAMYLPLDNRHGVHPQDDGFLDRPAWNFATQPGDDRPLLLRFHPLTLYRHQVCKQPSVVLAHVLLGEEISAAQKRRDFDYYEPLTVHDSSLSASTWAILAAELGLLDSALGYFREGARLDLDDLHGNASHGAHMAAMAGTWLSLVWGFGGLRIDGDGVLQLRPVLPPDWGRYYFSLQWRGCLLTVTVSAAGVHYDLRRGATLTFSHNGASVIVSADNALLMPLPKIVPVARPRRVDAVIFDLDGVLTDTAELHFQSWSRLAAEIGVPFDRRTNERLKGIDRLKSLDIILERAARAFGADERRALAERKNGYFGKLLETLTPESLLPGALEALRDVRERGARVALASASRNAMTIITRLGIGGAFDYIADPAKSHPKPAPDIFLDAAAALRADPSRCIGVEDAIAGITAIKRAGMKAIGIGDSRVLAQADIVVPDMTALRIKRFL
ncbi:MAG TPA: beta-phosphoglucomutase [Steroidobacteraceae bacterium]|nr:beta-phosphoglucomutase [Steroidobacteraceae bacterium]